VFNPCFMILAPTALRHRPRGAAEWDRELALWAMALGRGGGTLSDVKNDKAQKTA
jgi:hypothetical protein